MTRDRWLVLAGSCLLGAALIACDDGGGEPTATPVASPTAAATAGTASPGVTPGSAEPGTTPRTGEPATIELMAEPQTLVCDGARASKVTARVMDADGRPVADGTAVHFSVVTLGTADPIDATTTDGTAETSIVALGSQVGVVVNVTAGAVQEGIRIDCQ